MSVATQAKIELSKVMSVYSGRDGKCCCGCAGTHSYASIHREAASKDRGYEVTDEDISDRNVSRIVKKMNRSNDVDVSGDHASLVVENRLYVAYFVQ